MCTVFNTSVIIFDIKSARRKQKWSVDPRNSAWSNDESKFGQKMLERMGWSKGKGLGKTEQGSTEHIKVKVKNNSLGLGTAVNHEDNWIAHQDDFNQLLADLNNCHGQNNTENPTQDKGFSLEEKSKTSKKRVHYMKFTKGKDLSSRSETDLACIFGKRAKQETKDQDEGSSGSDSQEDKEDSETLAYPEIQPNTVTSSLTMQEYFAQRMALLKRTNTATSAPSTPASTEDSTPNASDAEQTKKKRKNKKDRERNRDAAEEDMQTRVTGESVEEPQNHSQKKKKKKKSRRNEEDEVNGASTVMEEEESREQVEADEQPTVEIENQDSKVSEKKKKKKKKREQDDGEKEEEVTEEMIPKQKKKKQKK